jgi:histidine triad (HIT) family protein
VNNILDMKSKDCVFCKIVKEEIPSYKIHETNDYLTFLDISQFTQVHTVVITKKHIKSVWDSKNPDKYYSLVHKIANHFRSLGYKYVDSLILGRKIHHAHIHLIPHNGEVNDYKKACEKIGFL